MMYQETPWCYITGCRRVTGLTWGCLTGIGRQQAQQWCLAHAFELVELNPEELPDEDGKTETR